MTVIGTSADVSAVTGDDLQVVVDLSELSSATGSYTVPAQITVTGGDVGVSGNYVVQVTIRDEGGHTDTDAQEPAPSA